MKKLHTLTFAIAASAVVLTGCQYPNGEPNNTGSGALIGAGTGALIGGANGRGGGGALVGAAIGAIAGTIIGGSIDEDQRERLHAQAPQTYVRVEQGQPLATADVKALVQAGVNDDIIISQIRNSHTIYHLSAADIIDLHSAGVSDKVVDAMINTASSTSATTTTTVVEAAPPPPQTDVIVASPGSGYVWIGGEWVWNSGWYWRSGYWSYPPFAGSIWIGGGWHRGSRGWYHSPGHWRR